MTFDCVEGCNRTGHNGFPTRKGRTQHQLTCTHTLALEQTVICPRRLEELSTRASKRCRTDNIGTGRDSENQPSETPPPSPPAPPSPNPAPARTRPATRSHTCRLRIGFRNEHDALPEGPQPLQAEPAVPPALTAHTTTTTQTRRRRQPFATEPDIFGRYRVYYCRPFSIPDTNAPITLLTSTTNTAAQPQTVNSIIAPCPNISAFYIQRHHWLGGGTKSLDDRDALCNDVLLQPDFKREDIIGVNFRTLDDKLAEAAKTWDPACPPSEGWKSIPLRVQIPPLRSAPSSADHYYTIHGFRSRSLLDVMRRQFSRNDISTFHYDPFESYCQPPGAPPNTPPIQIRDQIYSSPAMMRIHRAIQALNIRDLTCTLPRVVAAFMFSSDGVQFGNFCHAKGWPIFGSFGNIDKYERCKPLSNTLFHIAHIPTLPDAIAEKITALRGKPPTDTLMTHLRRELMHEVWKSLLDDEFVDAWYNGIVIKCADGVTRRVFPRILTYSADYPEKVLIAAIRNNGTCLCPRCLVQKSSASKMGSVPDMRLRVIKRRIVNNRYRDNIARARSLIYDEGRVVQSTLVEQLLKPESYVPTLNAFSSQLGNDFNIFSTLVVDQLHEIELGVWKAVFKHLVRLLYVSGQRAVTEFNKRFRAVPTFRSTIRLFSEDVASMGRLAARDFEDILQCCMPVFEGLLPEVCEEPAQHLIFLFAEWHGLAKLRLHTSVTLKVMKTLTTRLGTALRDFAKLTEGMDIRETPKEYARRRKQYEANKSSTMSKKKAGARKRKADEATEENGDEDGRRRCTLNLDTYKMHSMGDYVPTIEDLGTTDSYSTQIGELQNRKIKAQYARTNRREVVAQMTRIGDICSALEDMDDALKKRSQHSDSPELDAESSQSLLEGDPYFIGAKDRSEDMIPSIPLWVDNQRGDEAIKYFIPQLKRHLLARILGSREHPDFDEQHLAQLHFHQGRMYQHRTLRTNYTTYDVLRHQDVLNPSARRCFALLPAEFELNSDAHPYIYAKILGVYHAKVKYGAGLPRRFDFVHVRWLYYDYERLGGWKASKLDRLSYAQCQTEQDILDSFDFVDPTDIIRATHLIPDFQSGISASFLRSPSSIAHDNKDHTDWEGYYVNRFVDRDMLMRYIGGGLGHFKQEIGQTAIQTDSHRDGDGDEGGDGEDNGGNSEDNGGDGDADVDDDGEGQFDEEEVYGHDTGGVQSDSDDAIDSEGSINYETDVFDDF